MFNAKSVLPKSCAREKFHPTVRPIWIIIKLVLKIRIKISKTPIRVKLSKFTRSENCNVLYIVVLKNMFKHLPCYHISHLAIVFLTTAGANVLIKSHLGKQIQEYGWHWYSLHTRYVNQMSSTVPFRCIINKELDI